MITTIKEFEKSILRKEVILVQCSTAKASIENILEFFEIKHSKF